jgi:hypothetical protein
MKELSLLKFFCSYPIWNKKKKGEEYHQVCSRIVWITCSGSSATKPQWRLTRQPPWTTTTTAAAAAVHCYIIQDHTLFSIKTKKRGNFRFSSVASCLSSSSFYPQHIEIEAHRSVREYCHAIVIFPLSDHQLFIRL